MTFSDVVVETQIALLVQAIAFGLALWTYQRHISPGL